MAKKSYLMPAPHELFAYEKVPFNMMSAWKDISRIEKMDAHVLPIVGNQNRILSPITVGSVLLANHR